MLSSRPRARTWTGVVAIAVLAITGADVGQSHGVDLEAATVAQVTAAAQTIAGFGASGAWWVNDLAHFSPGVRTQAGDLLFDSSGIQLSQYRYNIGGGGVGVAGGPRAPQTFLTSDGSYDWTKDPGGQAFLKMASAAGVPDLIGFVNSAPSVWTSNGKSCGGRFVTSDNAAYAGYLSTIVSHFAGQGVRISEISPMNEPDNTFGSCGQEGMTVPAADRAGVISAVGSALSAAGLPTTVIADESSQTSQLLSEAPTWLANPAAASAVSAIAHHTYDFPGDTNLQRVGALGAVNGKPVWGSEICCQVTGGGYGQQYDPTIAGGLVLANYIYRDFTLAGDSAFQWWTALSPVMGCDPVADPSCATSVNSSGWNDGLIYYDPKYATNGNQKLYPVKRFYVLGQYSKFVRPGAVRYAINGTPGGVQAMTFWRDNSWQVVVTNTNTSATAFALNLGSGTLTSSGAYRTSATENISPIAAPSIAGSTMSTTLPAQSVSTFLLGSSGRPGSGGYPARQLIGAGSGRCLDVPGASTTNGTRLEIHDCDGGSNQRFTLTASGAITVYGNKCLDAYQQGTSAGTVVDIYICNGGRNQRWEPHPNGTITNAQSGLCLDVVGQATGNGSKVDIWPCNGGSNQSWSLN